VIKRMALACSASVVALALGATPAFAHAKYVSSSPAAESTVATLPSTLSVAFSEELRSVTLTVIGPDGSTINTDKGSFDLSERTRATTPLRASGPGRYTVTWTSVSNDDGDSANGTFGFTVAATVAAVPTSAPAPAPGAAATPPAPATCPTTDKPDPGIDSRVNTYCKRQLVRDQYRGKIHEATFNEALAAGEKLEDALSAAMEELEGKEG
jgi:copper resistance protein C